MDISSFASKYKSWVEQYNWDTCLNGRREYGEFLSSFLTSHSRVINLDGVYGSGKTEFIRRLYVELAEKKHPVVYIDIWESDFSNNPLAVICSEFLQQIEFALKEKAPNGKAKPKSDAKKKINELKSKFGCFLKYMEVGAILAGEPEAATVTKAASAAVTATPDFDLNTKADKLVDLVKQNHLEAVQALKDIRELITYISGILKIIYELNMPIVVLIDELDRCRPNYAIEVLEVIKHFFETEGCTFLVATNTDVLEHSVRSVYGQSFDAKLYLRRFFSRKVNLPRVSVNKYLAAKQLDFDKYEEQGLKLYPFVGEQQKNNYFFAEVFEHNNLALRDIEQILDRFQISLDYAVNYSKVKLTHINTVVLILGLLEQHLESDSLYERLNENPISFSVAENLPTPNRIRLHDFAETMQRCVTFLKPTTAEIIKNNAIMPSADRKLAISSSTPFDEGTFGEHLKFDFHQVFSDMQKGFERPYENYWMWDDYKKVILLSGNIE
ncbi:NTPase KAP [Pseudoalteromonas sp. CO348]|uniref:KAP family P-loop NTPase fold protein n=1 Tax=Pseudoalteromonas sp. CO348 TaxID=1777271 RepID=UPI001022B819|nr:P-loop NTPase fold protein [Pseudoalteromonas sp. CO348]RZG05539.1 NTPase KAP [Pseudoalteromonas sp. CO348]